MEKVQSKIQKYSQFFLHNFFEVLKILFAKKSNECEQILADLSFSHRGSQANYQLVQTSYIYILAGLTSMSFRDLPFL